MRALSVVRKPRAARSKPDPNGRALRRLLYVAEPGIRDYLEYGGHGLLVFDIDHGHRFVKRIPTGGSRRQGQAAQRQGRLRQCRRRRKIYISTTQQLMCLDLVTEKLLWEKTYERGCDRMSMTPDGKLIFLPSFEGPLWYVVRASDGEELGADHARLGRAQHGRRSRTARKPISPGSSRRC